MKLITFAVPSYNSQDYLHTCVDSLLKGGDEVEILIINDGSVDKTYEIAEDYQKRYPNIVKAVHKENGGHGSGINIGLKLAQGLYYKVVDSDDWLDEEALKKLLDVIRENVEKNVNVDMYITNFIYDRVFDNQQYVSQYTKFAPQGRVFSWEEFRSLTLWRMLLMHAITYKTQAIRDTGITLPEHTFYEDNLYAYAPLPKMKDLYYLNVDLYHYFIGRPAQSVTRENISKRYDQQIRVMKLMLDSYSYEEIMAFPKPLRRLMFHCLAVIMQNTIFFTTSLDTRERREAYHELWDTLKKKDVKLYRKLSKRTNVAIVYFQPWHLKSFTTRKAYNFLCRRVKLGV